jgi:hypothetical protein
MSRASSKARCQPQISLPQYFIPMSLPYRWRSSEVLQVTAHNLPVAGGADKTVFLIKFHAAVIAREASLSKSQ